MDDLIMEIFKRHQWTYVTGSDKGLPNNDFESFKPQLYYYVRVNINGNMFYLDEHASLTDQSHAAILGKQESRKLVQALKDKYKHISIFSTTRKLSSI